MRSIRVALISALILALGAVVPGASRDLAFATAPGIVSPSSSTATPGQSHDPGDFGIEGFTTEELLVSVGFVNAPAGTSFSFSAGTSDLEPAFGYESTTWTNLDRISFYATQSEANTALASLSVVAGSTLGDFEVKVSATEKIPGVVYNPKNDHFYEYVDAELDSDPDGVSYGGSVQWSEAYADAARKSRKGVSGYLATITSEDETLFVANNVTTDTKVWVSGAQVYGGVTGSTDTRSVWKWVAGPEGTTFWTKPSVALGGTSVSGVYSNWCDNEPNNAAEPYVVIRWRSVGDTDCWNDWAGTNAGSGYIVEYGSNAADKGYAGVYTATTTITVNYPITNLSVTAGNAQARVDWDAPSGGTVTGYTVTSTPGSKTCSTSGDTACTVVGLTNNTGYTFEVVAEFDGTDATSVAVSGSVTPVDSAPGLSGPTTASVDEIDSVTLGSFSISDPFSCGWGEMTATVATAGGTVSASSAGAASVTNSGSSSMTISGTRTDVANTLSSVSFSPNTSGDVDVTTTVVPSVDFEAPDGNRYHLNEDTGHYYRVVSAAEVSAASGDDQRAKAAALASSLRFCGFQGYLVAVDDEDEQSFIEDSGAFDALAGVSLYSSGTKSSGTWKWAPGDGAPSGLYPLNFFEQGATKGTSPWHSGEPNSTTAAAYHTFWYTDSNGDGNTVYGWDDNTSNNVTSYGALIEFGATTSFSAPSVTTTVTVAPSYTVTYDGNLSVPEAGALDAGSSLPGYQEDVAGEQVTIGAAVARQGLTFNGWNTASDGSGDSYEAGATFTIPSSNTTLYAQWLIPEAARLFGQTYAADSDDANEDGNPDQWESGDRKETIVPVVNDEGNSVVGNVRGITTDGSSVFFLPDGKNGFVREVGFDGVLIEDHAVTSNVDGVSLTSAVQRELTYSSGCIFLRAGGLGGDDLYCIDVSTWTMVEVDVPISWPLLTGQGWLTGNLVDFPDGRIGVLSENNQGSIVDSGDGTGITCPDGFQCKTLRLYSVSNSGADVTLSHSRDILLADDETVATCPYAGYEDGWPCDNHGMATDGTYLYQSYHNNGYKVFALRANEPSYVVFNGDGSGTCGANDGDSGGDCLINFTGNTPSWASATVANATFFARDHVNQRYLMGDYGNPQFIYTGAAVPPDGEGSVDAPSAPRSLSGSSGNTQVALSWVAPSNNGGAPIARYDISVSPGGLTYQTTSTSLTITGLTNGTSYSFTVTARNNGGSSVGATTTATPGVSSSATPRSNNDHDEPVVTPVVTPNVTRPTVRLPFPTPTPPRPTVLSAPVKTPTSVSTPVDRLVSRIGGVPAPVTTSTNGVDELSVSTSSLRLSLKMSQQSSVSETPEANAELTIKPGAKAAVTATGLLPNTTLQVWLPNVSERELGRLSVNANGEIQGELGLSSNLGENPLPVGRQTLQMTGYDADGNQTVVEMPVNIAQGPPTPEPNRQEGALPELGTGQSLATSAGVPTPTTVSVLGEQNAVSVTGDGWAINMNIPAVSGTVQDDNGQPVIRLVQSSLASMSGSGMQPGTIASVWFFSEPTLMGTVAVAEDGSFTLDVMVDAQFIPVGNHTVQVQGVGTDGYIKSVNMGVLVEEPAAQTTASSAMVMLWWALAGAVAIALLIVIIVSRRRRQA